MLEGWRGGDQECGVTNAGTGAIGMVWVDYGQGSFGYGTLDGISNVTITAPPPLEYWEDFLDEQMVFFNNFTLSDTNEGGIITPVFLCLI